MVRGIKANDYDATYSEAVFDVVDRGKVYEIRELNSGMAFFVDKGAFDDKEGSKKRTDTHKGDGKGHTVCGTGNRAIDDSSHKDDDGVQSRKRFWYAGEQIRERLNTDRGLQRAFVKPIDRAGAVQEPLLGESQEDRATFLAENPADVLFPE